MGKEVLKKFGRYFLLDQIAQGGMAEIYRACPATLEGAGRLIVIKRIQAGYGANSEFLQMFKSEIKVTMGFSHPNIVQVHDFGEEQNQPFIVMELVDGKNLRQFLTKISENVKAGLAKDAFPVELAVYIIEQSASALHYAHSFKDKISGQPLNIVHRDISPQNILISYDGGVKVIDFGIAKATVNSEATRAGIIKGKPSYLSPEQITGEPLDGRCDIFALGAVLWEMLTGRKLFSGENDLAILKMIESCQTSVKPPSSLNSKVPKELDYIVLRMLAKQRDKRFQTAEELQRALHRFLYAHMGDFNPADLSYYSKDLFQADIVEDRKRIQKLNDKAATLLSLEQRTEPTKATGGIELQRQEEDRTVLRTTQSTGSRDVFEAAAVPAAGVKIDAGAPAASPQPHGRHGRTGQTSPGLAAGRRVPAQRATGKARQSGQSPLRRVWVGLAATLAAVFLAPELGIRIPVVSDLTEQLAASPYGSLVLEGELKGVSVLVDNQMLARDLPVTLPRLPAGKPLKVVVRTSSETFEREVTLKSGESRILSVDLGQAHTFAASGSGVTVPGGERSPAAKVVTLRMNILPGGGTPSIQVNGRAVNPDNPVIQIPLDSPLELAVERKEFLPLRREFVVTSQQVGNLREWVMDVQLEPVSFGFLTVRTTPSAEASMTIDRAPAGANVKPWVKKTPFENEKLPVGTYNIRLYNEVLGMEKIVTVTVQDNKIVTVDTALDLKN